MQSNDTMMKALFEVLVMQDLKYLHTIFRQYRIDLNIHDAFSSKSDVDILMEVKSP